MYFLKLHHVNELRTLPLNTFTCLPCISNSRIIWQYQAVSEASDLPIRPSGDRVTSPANSSRLTASITLLTGSPDRAQRASTPCSPAPRQSQTSASVTPIAGRSTALLLDSPRRPSASSIEPIRCPPSRINWLAPAERGESIGPGTAAKRRPMTPAWVAVFMAPDLCPASTTIVALAKAAMIRFRRGKQP